MIKFDNDHAVLILYSSILHLTTLFDTFIHYSRREGYVMKISKDTKRLIGDMAVTILVFSCLAFLAWLMVFFKTHKIVLQVIST